MKIIILAFVIALSVTSCQKDSKACYVCHHKVTGADLAPVCGISAGECKVYEQANDCNCQPKQ